LILSFADWGVELGTITVQGIPIFLHAKAAAKPAFPPDEETESNISFRSFSNQN
jgi:hypothetical protein